MTFQEAKDAIRRAKPMLKVVNDLAEGLEKAAEMEKELKVLEARKAVEEQALAQVVMQRGNVIADAAAESKKLQALRVSQAAEYAAKIGDESARILAAKQAADKRISELKAEVASAEAFSKSRISIAESAAAAAEARVKNAEQALAALKRA